MADKVKSTSMWGIAALVVVVTTVLSLAPTPPVSSQIIGIPVGPLCGFVNKTMNSTTNDTSCDDGNICTTNDTCVGSNCDGVAFVPPQCDDGNACTTDDCDPTANNNTGGCTHTPNSNPCDDGNLCTNNDQCGNSTCSGEAFFPAVCNDGNPFTFDSCNAAANGGAGACEHFNQSQAAPTTSLLGLQVAVLLLLAVAGLTLRRKSMRSGR